MMQQVLNQIAQRITESSFMEAQGFSYAEIDFHPRKMIENSVKIWAAITCGSSRPGYLEANIFKQARPGRLFVGGSKWAKVSSL